MAIFYRYQKLQKYKNGSPIEPPEYKPGEFIEEVDTFSLKDCEEPSEFDMNDYFEKNYKPYTNLDRFLYPYPYVPNLLQPNTDIYRKKPSYGSFWEYLINNDFVDNDPLKPLKEEPLLFATFLYYTSKTTFCLKIYKPTTNNYWRRFPALEQIEIKEQTDDYAIIEFGLINAESAPIDTKIKYDVYTDRKVQADSSISILDLMVKVDNIYYPLKHFTFNVSDTSRIWFMGYVDKSHLYKVPITITPSYNATGNNYIRSSGIRYNIHSTEFIYYEDLPYFSAGFRNITFYTYSWSLYEDQRLTGHISSLYLPDTVYVDDMTINEPLKMDNVKVIEGVYHYKGSLFKSLSETIVKNMNHIDVICDELYFYSKEFYDKYYNKIDFSNLKAVVCLNTYSPNNIDHETEDLYQYYIGKLNKIQTINSASSYSYVTSGAFYAAWNNVSENKSVYTQTAVPRDVHIDIKEVNNFISAKYFIYYELDGYDFDNSPSNVMNLNLSNLVDYRHNYYTSERPLIYIANFLRKENETHFGTIDLSSFVGSEFPNNNNFFDCIIENHNYVNKHVILIEELNLKSFYPISFREADRVYINSNNNIRCNRVICKCEMADVFRKVFPDATIITDC